MDTKNKIPGVSFVKRNIGTIIGLILLVIIVSISTPKFLTSSNILNLLKSNSVNAIISCGMLMAILMGEIDISVGSTVGLSGIIGAYMITNVGLVGSSSIMTFGLFASHLLRTTFCWFPPLRFPASCFGEVIFMENFLR